MRDEFRRHREAKWEEGEGEEGGLGSLSSAFAFVRLFGDAETRANKHISRRMCLANRNATRGEEGVEGKSRGAGCVESEDEETEVDVLASENARLANKIQELTERIQEIEERGSGEKTSASVGEGSEGSRQETVRLLGPEGKHGEKDGKSRELPVFEGLRLAAAVEKGVVLATHPSTIEPCFGRSLVLIVEHTEVERRGLGPYGGHGNTMGFILNKPTKLRLADAWTSHDDPDIEVVLDTFAANRVYIGGPCQTDLACLHSVEALESSSRKICDGLYYGGMQCLQEAAELIGEGGEEGPSASHFKIIFGTAVWWDGQLLGELKKNFWFLCRAPVDVLRDIAQADLAPDLPGGPRLPQNENRALKDSQEANYAGAPSYEGHFVSVDAACLWARVVGSLGSPEYRALAASFGGVDAAAVQALEDKGEERIDEDSEEEVEEGGWRGGLP